MGRLLGVAALLIASLAFAGAGRAATIPNEPVWGQEWALHKLQMPDVWDITTGSPDVVIATVDTGVNPAIGDLQGALVPGWDFIQDDAVPRDTQGHGTHLASALVARGNNGQGIAGLCWQCKLMPVRVSDDGSATGGEIAEGINWAVTHGARIIVIGLNAGGAPDPAERQAVLNAAARGVLVVASAGNTGTSELRYPAAFPEVLAVGATNDFDQLYFWSTRGPWVKLAAPGCMMIIDAAVGPGTLCGTSFTPAAVAGVAALLFSLNPGLTMYQVHAALVSTAIPVAGIGGGRLNPLGAIEALGLRPASVPPPPPPPAPTPSPPPGASGQQAATGKAAKYAYRIDFKRGVAKRRVTRTLQLGPGRLEVLFQAARVEECQIMVSDPKGRLFLSLLPPGDPTLRSFTLPVKAGRYRVDVECDPARRRSFTLTVSGWRPVAPATTASRRP
jgi:subtilisin family serine protease